MDSPTTTDASRARESLLAELADIEARLTALMPVAESAGMPPAVTAGLAWLRNDSSDLVLAVLAASAEG